MTGAGVDTATVVAAELAALAEPLPAALAVPGGAAALLTDAGITAADVPPELLALAAPASDLLATVGSGIEPGDVGTVAEKLRRLVDAIDALAGTSLGVGAPQRLLEYLLARHLLVNRPRLGQVLRLLGLLVVEDVPAAGGVPAHTRSTLPLDGLPRFLSDPRATMAAALGWGQEPMNTRLVFDAAALLAEAFGIEARYAQVTAELVGLFTTGVPDVDDRYRELLRWLVFTEEQGDGTFSRVGLTIAPVPPPGGAGAAGLLLLGYASAAFAEGIALTDDLTMVIEARAAVDGGIGVVLRPGAPVEIRSGLETSAPGATAAVSVGLQHDRADGAATVLVGQAGGSRIEFRSLTLVAGARMGSGGVASAFVEARLVGSRVVIAKGGSDGFLSALLPADGFAVDFDLDVVLDSVSGLIFSGGAGLEIRHPTHLTLGPVDVTGLTTSVRPVDGAIVVGAGADLTAGLGPLRAVVENVGLAVRLDPAAAQRNLGLVDLSFAFKAPDGVGLTIDTGVVKGGGYLYLDPDKGEYAGALELSIAGLVRVTAIGLITTRPPGGSPEFSLLAVLTAEFDPGIQLSFGFTLIGVGGLVGLHRSARLDALAQGIRTGALDSVLFPRNVVANAPRILSDLRAIFPEKQGTFLVGPMARIGWGTPTLVSLSLGVIIEIPGNIAILGVLTVALPTADAPLVLIKVSFVGAIEFDRRRVWFFASLVGSRVLAFPIDGELGLLMAFGDDATFVLSVGGSHPRSTLPALPFPAPARIGITILQTKAARITAQGYLAVTSNSVQFGAHAELDLGFDAFGISGHLGFDALFRFSPFAFEIDAGASMSLRAFGIGLLTVRLELTLSGPAPWRARGVGSLRVLFFEISADFDITWGDAPDTIAQAVPLLELVADELEVAASWTAELQAGATSQVTLRRIDPAVDGLVLQPAGLLRISQHAAPLGLRVQRVGTARPSDVNRVTVGAQAGILARAGTATEQFAMGQYQDMTDAQRLSRPAFERQTSGLLLTGNAQLATSRAVRRTVRYEQVVVDTFYERTLHLLTTLHPVLFGRMLAVTAAALSALSGCRERERQPFAEKITVRSGGFVVASTATNVPVAEDARFDGEAAAREYLARLGSSDARDAHVIPAFEAA